MKLNEAQVQILEKCHFHPDAWQFLHFVDVKENGDLHWKRYVDGGFK